MRSPLFALRFNDLLCAPTHGIACLGNGAITFLEHLYFVRRQMPVVSRNNVFSQRGRRVGSNVQRDNPISLIASVDCFDAAWIYLARRNEIVSHAIRARLRFLAARHATSMSHYISRRARFSA